MQNAGRGLQRAKGGTGVERVSERERERARRRHEVSSDAITCR